MNLAIRGIDVQIAHGDTFHNDKHPDLLGRITSSPIRRSPPTSSASAMARSRALLPAERIERAILLIRGLKVILDKDLAALYGVTTGNLNKAVGRNLDRFPDDFMFRLTAEEFADLKFHFGRSSWGGTRKPPRAFTEQGVAMLSSVLRSKRAVQVNVEIMRAFVRLREMVAGHEDLVRRIDELEQRYDRQFRSVFDAIRALISEEAKPRKRIGFHAKGQGRRS